MIQLQEVSKQFGSTKAVDRISFTVQEGETLVLLGTSGCGKTTTLRMINRLIEPGSGQVLINGQPVTAQAPELLRRKIGYVLQDNGLFPHYTVEENIGIVPTLLGWDPARIRSRCHALLNKLHLPPAEFAHKYPAQLSGGQQQRVGLARALAADPPILLMDEPFGALDPVTRIKVRQDFLSLDEISRKTIVLVTHDVQEAFEMGHRVCLMHKGAIEQLGTPAELLFRPASDFVRSFFETQRILLELKVVRLQDCWPWLPETGAVNSAQLPVLTGETSYWEALEWFTKGHDLLCIRYSNSSKCISSADLLAAFRYYKVSQLN